MVERLLCMYSKGENSINGQLWFSLEFVRKTYHFPFSLQSQFEEQIQAIKNGSRLSELPKVQISELSFPTFNTVSLLHLFFFFFEGNRTEKEWGTISLLAGHK